MGYEIRKIPSNLQTEEQCVDACRFDVTCRGDKISHPLQFCSVRTYSVLHSAYTKGGQNRFYIFALMTAEEQSLVNEDILDALNWTYQTYQYLHNPTSEQTQKYIEWNHFDYLAKPISQELQSAIVKIKPSNIIGLQKIQELTYQTQLEAVKIDPSIICSFNNPRPSVDLMQEAIKLDSSLRSIYGELIGDPIINRCHVCDCNEGVEYRNADQVVFVCEDCR